MRTTCIYPVCYPNYHQLSQPGFEPSPADATACSTSSPALSAFGAPGGSSLRSFSLPGRRQHDPEQAEHGRMLEFFIHLFTDFPSKSDPRPKFLAALMPSLDNTAFYLSLKRTRIDFSIKTSQVSGGGLLPFMFFIILILINLTFCFTFVSRQLAQKMGMPNRADISLKKSHMKTKQQAPKISKG